MKETELFERDRAPVLMKETELLFLMKEKELLF